jgi:DNA-directed RNA polymerase subunit M
MRGDPMEFCEKCGTRLVPKRKKDSKEVFLFCPKCEYKKPAESLVKTPLVSEVKPESPIVVISKREQKLKTMPTIAIECPKCKNNQAYVWQVQTRGADESSTQFFRCTKCNYTFREYS